MNPNNSTKLIFLVGLALIGGILLVVYYSTQKSLPPQPEQSMTVEEQSAETVIDQAESDPAAAQAALDALDAALEQTNVDDFQENDLTKDEFGL